VEFAVTVPVEIEELPAEDDPTELVEAVEPVAELDVDVDATSPTPTQ
jgi:hypothetical protein